MPTKVLRVFPYGGMWAMAYNGSDTILKVVPTKSIMLQYARKKARNENLELVVEQDNAIVSF
jgi:hypothetical protein